MFVFKGQVMFFELEYQGDQLNGIEGYVQIVGVDQGEEGFQECVVLWIGIFMDQVDEFIDFQVQEGKIEDIGDVQLEQGFIYFF